MFRGEDIKRDRIDIMSNSTLKAVGLGLGAQAYRSTGVNAPYGKTKAFPYQRRRLWNALALGAGDALALMFALLFAGGLRWWIWESLMIPNWSGILILAWWGGALSARLLPSWGMGAVEELRRLVLLLAGIFSGVAVTLFLAKESEGISRIVLLLGFAFSVLLVPSMRMTVKRLLVSRGLWGVPTVIYGEAITCAMIVKALREQAGFGYAPVGIFNDKLEWGKDFLEGVPILGGLGQTTHKAPVAILAIQGIEREHVAKLLDGPLASYRHMMLIPDLFEVQSLWVQARDLGGILGLEISRNLLDPVARWIKRSLELTAVVMTACFWAPLCLLLALIIWLEDRANPFFFQERVGKGGRLFKTWKFRTMVPNAEEILQLKLAQDHVLKIEWKTNSKLCYDPRVTRVGRLLRKTSLDELPQLINVLRGEMSLVGPRPLPCYHHQKLPKQVRVLRERVWPGITGLWQVSGRSTSGNPGMLRWDSYYVRNWSVWLDIIILVRTMKAVARRDGAY
jgi:Undecaprenyl-phosphate galactose phosphotransferase WbaP